MNNEPMLEVVVFTLAAGRYALESAYVREVHPVTEVTPLPCTPPFLAGVMNVRGDILAIYDLRVFSGLEAASAEVLNHVIVVDYADLAFGILADASIETAVLPAGDLETSARAPGVAPGLPIKGMTKDRLIVLDLPGMTADKRFVIHDTIVDRHSDAVMSERL